MVPSPSARETTPKRITKEHGGRREKRCVIRSEAWIEDLRCLSKRAAGVHCSSLQCTCSRLKRKRFPRGRYLTTPDALANAALLTCWLLTCWLLTVPSPSIQCQKVSYRIASHRSCFGRCSSREARDLGPAAASPGERRSQGTRGNCPLTEDALALAGWLASSVSHFASAELCTAQRSSNGAEPHGYVG